MVIIIGKGSHARMLSSTLSEAMTENRFLDEDEKLKFSEFYIIGYGNIVTLSSSGLERRKSCYFNFFPYPLSGIYHKTSVVRGDLGRACQCLSLSHVGPYASIGDNTIINTAAVVEHDCVVGAHCHIAPNATLCGSVKIGELTHIGAGAVVLQGLTIGSGCVVGAGSVVTKDMPNNTTWIGTKFHDRV